MKAENRLGDMQELGLPQYEDTELENDKYEESEGETEREDMHEDSEAKKELHKYLLPRYLAKIQKESEAENELLNYFYEIIGNKNPDSIIKMKRGGKLHKPDGRIRLLKVSL